MWKYILTLVVLLLTFCRHGSLSYKVTRLYDGIYVRACVCLPAAVLSGLTGLAEA